VKAPFPDIAVVTAYFPPQNSAGANRLRSFAETFAVHGLRCVVFAPDYGDPTAGEAFDRTKVVRVRTNSERRHEGFLARFAEESKVSLKLLLAARKVRADVYVVTSPFLSSLLLAPLVLPHRKLVLDVRDLTWEYQVEGGLPIRAAQAILRAWSHWALRSARLISASSVQEVTYLSAMRGAPAVVHVSNGVEAKLVQALSAQTPGPEPLVLYAGTLGYAQGVEIFGSLAQTAPDLKFLAVGDGVERASLQAAAKRLPNLTVEQRLPRNELVDLYGRAGALFLRLRPGFRSAVPSKIYEYAATGRPIVYMGSDQDACWRQLQAFDGVQRVDDDDTKAAIAALRQAIAMGRKASSRNPEVVLQSFTRERQAEKLLEAILGIADAGDPAFQRRVNERVPEPTMGASA